MYSDFDLQCEIATKFMNNNVGLATKYCYNIIHNNNGVVADDFYLMLFDMLKVQNQKDLFEKAAEQYHKITGNLPPDWEDKSNNKMVSEFNTLSIKGSINASIIDSLNQFYQSCCEQRFGRLDFNHFKLENSDSLGMQMLLNTLYKLKRLKDTEVLIMGDNIILGFNPKDFIIQNTIINDDNENISHQASLKLLKMRRELADKEALDAFNQELDKVKEKVHEVNSEIQQIKKEYNLLPNELNPQGFAGGGMRNSVPRKINEKLQELEAKLRELNAEKAQVEQKMPAMSEASYIEKRFIDDNNEESQNIPALSEDEIQAQNEQELKKREEILILLKLEILQWNGLEQDYISLSNHYRQTYKKFSPDYQVELESKNRIKQQNRMGAFRIVTAAENNFNSVNTNTPVIQSLANEINSHNLDALFQYLDDLNQNTHPLVFMNLNKSNFFTYNAAEQLMLFIQEQRLSGKHYDLFVKNANSLIKVIFKMSGLSEYIKY